MKWKTFVYAFRYTMQTPHVLIEREGQMSIAPMIRVSLKSRHGKLGLAKYKDDNAGNAQAYWYAQQAALMCGRRVLDARDGSPAAHTRRPIKRLPGDG